MFHWTMIADGVNLATAVGNGYAMAKLGSATGWAATSSGGPGCITKRALERGLTFDTYWVTVLNVKTSIEVFTACEQSQLWKSWCFPGRNQRNLQEKLGLLTPLGVQLRVLPTNALPVCQFCLHVGSWGECCPLERCGRVRHLWDAAKICMVDLPGHGPWGTCTEALPHNWKIRLYCDFLQHQSSIAPLRDTCHDDMAWVQLFQFKSEVVHAAVGSVDHVWVIVASL